MRTAGPRTVCAALAVLSAALPACSSSVPVRPSGVSVGSLGSRSELVFTAPAVAELASEAEGADSRRDWAMHAREAPVSEPMSLEEVRRIHLSTSNPDTVIYYQRQRYYDQERRWRSYR